MADKEPQRLEDAIIAPPPEKRGSFVGGPGIIFLFLILLIVAGIGIYGAATGNLGRWVDAARHGEVARLFEPGSGLAPAMAPASSGVPAPGVAGQGGERALVLTPMTPAELLATRQPPRSLHLPAGGFDQPPVDRYARAALFMGQRPRLAVTIVNLGHNSAVTAAAIADTPPEVSLSFSPYAPDLAAWIAAAQAFGHEVLVDMPLESRAYPAVDPGPLGLLTALNEQENTARLDRLLAGADGVLGVATQGGDRFLTDAAALRPVLGHLGARGLGLIVAATFGESLGEAAQGIDKAPRHAIADVEIGHDLSRQAIQERMTEALARSRSSRASLIAVQPYPLSIAALTDIAAIARDRDLVLVPASALLTK
ncbi:hypothetical protein A8950_0531 [Dongia mobilis]|uniref:Divergent polysaccharide deacetylase n=1 Tax=Dongia mobilis TaxID=578943 RepID=A0A4R6WQZ1_9PROT|nr:divergent polysaccharide deacetylase family protein [Dongia mobilis]TDQ83985.1 hypothetical protein A8950_0531 [Dongia mobilis]